MKLLYLIPLVLLAGCKLHQTSLFADSAATCEVTITCWSSGRCSSPTPLLVCDDGHCEAPQTCKTKMIFMPDQPAPLPTAVPEPVSKKP